MAEHDRIAGAGGRWRWPDLAAALGAGEGRLILWVPVLLGCGIALYFGLRHEPAPSEYAVILGGTALFWNALRRAGRAGLRLLAWGALLLALGFGLAGWRAHQLAAPVLGWRYYGPIEGRVVRIDRSARDKIRLTLDRPVLRDLPPARHPARLRVVLSGLDLPETITPGTRVMLTGHLGPPNGPTEPGGFDFRRYAWFQQLGALGYTRSPVLIVAPAPKAGGDGLMAGHRARLRLSRAIQRQIGGQAGAMAAALITGDRAGVSSATQEAMRGANLSHLLSISGLHMGMLVGVVLTGSRLILALSGLALRVPAHKLAALVALLAAAIYFWLAGGSVATTRAFVMVAVMLGAVLADRRAISLQSLALAALVILTLWPETITHPGFQMSFAATAALILSWPPWRRVQPYVPRLLRPLAMLLVSSALAGAATAPISAAHFNRVADYGVLANLLAVPVMGMVVMPAAVLAGLLSPLGLAAPVLWVMGAGVRWILGVAGWISGIEGAWHAVPSPSSTVLPLLALGAALMVIPAGRWRWIGLPLALVGAGMWGLSPRPDLLIAPEGAVVGVMGAEGRVLSKPSGGAYVAEHWLLADGDRADQSTAAARSGFSGPADARRITAQGGLRIAHLTGKHSAALLAQTCAEADIVVSNQSLERPSGAQCHLLDLSALRQMGAVAGDWRGGAWHYRTQDDLTGRRYWAPVSGGGVSLK